MGGDADQEADARFAKLSHLIASSFGESHHFGEIGNRVSSGLASPIAIDLNGDGVRTVNMIDANIQFDLLGDNTKKRVGWLSGEDAFLAMDRNNNGNIDDVSELFGSTIRGEGYAELALLDDNHDDLIDPLDAAYTSLKTWQDSNLNGLTDQGELQTLTSMGITKLNLSYKSQEILDNGNLIGEVSSADVNGNIREMADVYFRYKDATNQAFGSRNGAINSLELAPSGSTLDSQGQNLLDAMAGFDAPAGYAGAATPSSQWTDDVRLAAAA